MYLNDVPPGLGGETRFPIAHSPEGSELRSAGAAVLGSGATAIFRDSADSADSADSPGATAESVALLDACATHGAWDEQCT